MEAFAQNTPLTRSSSCGCPRKCISPSHGAQSKPKSVVALNATGEQDSSGTRCCDFRLAGTVELITHGWRNSRPQSVDNMQDSPHQLRGRSWLRACLPTGLSSHPVSGVLRCNWTVLEVGGSCHNEKAKPNVQTKPPNEAKACLPSPPSDNPHKQGPEFAFFHVITESLQDISFRGSPLKVIVPRRILEVSMLHCTAVFKDCSRTSIGQLPTL